MNLELLDSNNTVVQPYTNDTLVSQLSANFGLDLASTLPTGGQHTPDDWNPQPALDVLSTAKDATDALQGSVKPVPGEEPLLDDNTMRQLMSDPALSNIQQITRDDRAVAIYTRQETVAHPLRDSLNVQIAQLTAFLSMYQQGGYTLRVA